MRSPGSPILIRRPAALESSKSVCPTFRRGISELCSSVSPDLTVISTPIHYHVENILAALGAGSNVLCEKPMCADDSDIARLIEARDKSGKFVMIGYQWTHSAEIQRLKRDILDGVYGQITSCRAIAFMARNRAYFQRSSRWAGRRFSPDGRAVNDSIANNAAAHYLHNLLFLSGASQSASCEARDITASLSRANAIENFDTIVTRARVAGDAKLTYIATHAAGISETPCFSIRFTGGEVNFDGKTLTGTTSGGEKIGYGAPSDELRKLKISISNVYSGKPEILCGIETASAQTRYITALSKLPVADFSPERVKLDESRDMLVVEGLAEELKSLYEAAK